MFTAFRPFRTATTLLAFTALAACSKKDDATPTPAPTTGVSYTVDGTSTTAATTNAGVFGSTVIVSGVTGSGNANKGVQLFLPMKTGTFTLSPTSDETATYLASSSDIYSATSGTIVVTTYSASTTSGASNIAGTFTFTGRNSAGATKTITNGTFNVKY